MFVRMAFMKLKLLKMMMMTWAFFAASITWAQSVDISGDYKTTFSYSMMVKSGDGSAGDGVLPIVSIEPVDEGHVNITLPPFVFSDKMKIESFVIENVELSQDDNGSLLFIKKFSSNDGNYEISGYGLSGSIKKGKLDMKVVYKAGKMPFKLTVNYLSYE